MAPTMPVGVYWGRFNPPHAGHLSVIRALRKQCRLVVAIGSSEHRQEPRNPFSGRERKEMIESYLKEVRIRDVTVVCPNDGGSESWAIRNLLRRCRPQLLFLSTEKRELAARAKRKVKVVRFDRIGRISSTRIRNAIARGDPRWMQWTGRSVVRWIREHHGVERIRRSATSPVRERRRGIRMRASETPGARTRIPSDRARTGRWLP